VHLARHGIQHSILYALAFLDTKRLYPIIIFKIFVVFLDIAILTISLMQIY
ncbi:hypothetical protein ACJX0J_022407, partial [Zea mays]